MKEKETVMIKESKQGQKEQERKEAKMKEVKKEEKRKEEGSYKGKERK